MTRHTALLTLALLSPALAGCLGGADAQGADVLATFYPLAFLAERIGGDNVSVGTVVPTGVEPHDWEPSPRDVSRLASSRLVLAQGAGFEPWLPQLVQALGARAPAVTETTEGLELHTAGGHEHGEGEGEEEGEGSLDPHTWLDPAKFAAQALAVERALVAAFPEHEAAFRERATALQADLDALDAAYRDGLRSCERRVVIVSHNAFGHMAERYDFDVLSVSGLSPEAEPSAATLSRLVEEAREHNVSIVFFEELVDPRVVEVIAREVGAETRVLSPVEGLSPQARASGEDYLSLMRANLGNLKDAMGCT